jgi:3-oxoadipate enol-lactonase
MTTQAGILERDGCPLHYWLHGAADKPLIVLTHGATVDHRMFDAQLETLTEHYRVLTWDMRGHGQSRPMGESFSVPRAVADLLAILDQIGVQQAVFVGQSTGGYVGQELVFRHPERVKALVMVDCACITFPRSALDGWLLRATPAILRLYPYDLLLKQTAQASAVTPAARQYMIEAVTPLGKADYVTIMKGVVESLHDEPNYRIDKPLLIVRGEHDHLGSIAQDAPRWAARDQAQYVVIPNAGHNSNQDNPTAFNRVLSEFLARL